MQQAIFNFAVEMTVFLRVFADYRVSLVHENAFFCQQLDLSLVETGEIHCHPGYQEQTFWLYVLVFEANSKTQLPLKYQTLDVTKRCNPRPLERFHKIELMAPPLPQNQLTEHYSPPPRRDPT